MFFFLPAPSSIATPPFAFVFHSSFSASPSSSYPPTSSLSSSPSLPSSSCLVFLPIFSKQTPSPYPHPPLPTAAPAHPLRGLHRLRRRSPRHPLASANGGADGGGIWGVGGGRPRCAHSFAAGSRSRSRSGGRHAAVRSRFGGSYAAPCWRAGAGKDHTSQGTKRHTCSGYKSTQPLESEPGCYLLGLQEPLQNEAERVGLNVIQLRYSVICFWRNIAERRPTAMGNHS